MRFVDIKEEEQLDMQTLHRARSRLVGERTALINQLRAILLERGITVPAHLYRWTKGDNDNPYFAFLGLADAVVVTGDSMSMLAEACATRKPVYIFDLGEGEQSMRPEIADAAAAARLALSGRRRLERAHVAAFLYRQMMKFGPERLSRDIRIIHKYLIDSGRAVWLGDEFPQDRSLPTLDCLGRAVARVRALTEGASSARSPAVGTVDSPVPLRYSA